MEKLGGTAECRPIFHILQSFGKDTAAEEGWERFTFALSCDKIWLNLQQGKEGRGVP